jgi:hypothetical protein
MLFHHCPACSSARSLAALIGTGLMDRGVARKVMTTSSKARNDADAKFKMKAQRATEGAQAMADYVADGDAVRAKTARLKELRLPKRPPRKRLKTSPWKKGGSPCGRPRPRPRRAEIHNEGGRGSAARRTSDHVAGYKIGVPFQDLRTIMDPLSNPTVGRSKRPITICAGLDRLPQPSTSSSQERFHSPLKSLNPFQSGSKAILMLNPLTIAR